MGILIFIKKYWRNIIKVIGLLLCCYIIADPLTSSIKFLSLILKSVDWTTAIESSPTTVLLLACISIYIHAVVISTITRVTEIFDKKEKD